MGQKWSGKLPIARNSKLEGYYSMPVNVLKSENEGGASGSDFSP